MELLPQQLPDWALNLDGAQGKELIHDEADCALLVRITGRRDKTVIETHQAARLPPPFRARLLSVKVTLTKLADVT